MNLSLRILYGNSSLKSPWDCIIATGGLPIRYRKVVEVRKTQKYFTEILNPETFFSMEAVISRLEISDWLE
jgi:hypothetical protein